MRAHVLKYMDGAVLTAAHDHRALADHGALEITHLGDLSIQAYVAPMAVVEKSVQFFLMPLRIGVHRKGDAAGVAHFPMQRRFWHCLWRGAVSVHGRRAWQVWRRVGAFVNGTDVRTISPLHRTLD